MNNGLFVTMDHIIGIIGLLIIVIGVAVTIGKIIQIASQNRDNNNSIAKELEQTKVNIEINNKDTIQKIENLINIQKEDLEKQTTALFKKHDNQQNKIEANSNDIIRCQERRDSDKENFEKNYMTVIEARESFVTREELKSAILENNNKLDTNHDILKQILQKQEKL